ncbi:MAG: hypothetical protein Q8M92_04030 [Candidatus Subteraquimicrobiales bacterium]|nr:hypothetical protein [Candidatus Subteraquimicrobiales bacterium]
MTKKKTPFMHTHHKAKKSIQGVTEVSIPQGSPNNITSTMSAPGSGTATTGKAAHIKEIPIGIRYGYIDKIDYSRSDAYIYHVVFPDTNSNVWARKMGDSAIKSIPEISSGENVTVLKDKFWVGLTIEYNSLTWVIVGEMESTYAPESGTWNIVKDDAKISIHKDSIKLGYDNDYIEIKNGYINIVSSNVKVNGYTIGG